MSLYLILTLLKLNVNYKPFWKKLSLDVLRKSSTFMFLLTGWVLRGNNAVSFCYTISMYHLLLLLKNPTILLDNEKLEKRKNKTTSSILPSFNQSRCSPLINRPISFASDYHVIPSTYVHMPPTFDVIADNFLQSKFIGALHLVAFYFILFVQWNEWKVKTRFIYFSNLSC